MKANERLILARMLARRDWTIPEIRQLIEMVEQTPLSDKDWQEVLDYIKDA